MGREFDPALFVSMVSLVDTLWGVGPKCPVSKILNLDPEAITPDLAKAVGIDPNLPDWKLQVENRFAAAKLIAKSQRR